MCILDDDDRPVPDGEPGEICIRGHNIMKGYWKRPDATKETLRGGWFHSGDIGVRDADGSYRIVDRKKDMIIRGGFNVYPREVEEVLYAHPAVLEAAVIGVPHESHGEEVKAVIVPRPESGLTREAVIAFCKERLAAYKYPRIVEFSEGLPEGPDREDPEARAALAACGSLRASLALWISRHRNGDASCARKPRGKASRPSIPISPTSRSRGW